ncbi:MAG: phosphoadenylyl-sulfate reductase [Xanthobacteraceae bacterium]|nr:phosphoadenylyl-sulfate reductase [Xanthobacteraceae bacterium]
MTAAGAIAQSVTATADLNARLDGASPVAVIAAAAELIGRDRLAVVSSFGTESAVLLKFVADVDPAIPVIFLDTGWLFEETLAYRDTLVGRLGLRDVRTVQPRAEDLARQDADRALWFSDLDACCRIRKVEPLARALAPFDAWVNGRKRFQGGLRAAIPVVEADGARLKFNPLAGLSAEDLRLTFDAAGLPPHPLAASGFASVGCMPCTSRSEADEEARAGRWRGRAKTECGIHTVPTA